MSSLGDVILAQRALHLSADFFEKNEIHWLVGKEYASLLEQIPAISRVISYERKNGFWHWMRFIQPLIQENYDEIWDLHSNFRTFLFRLLEWLKTAEIQKWERWKIVPKQRIRLWGYFLAKDLWPKRWRPTPWWQRYFFIADSQHRSEQEWKLSLRPFDVPNKISQEWSLYGDVPRLGVMAGALGAGKAAPIETFQKVCQQWVQVTDGKGRVVILGTERDQPVMELAEKIRTEKNFRAGPLIESVYFAHQGFSLPETAQVISRLTRIVSNDTGIVHLAEALDVPVTVLFGPTRPDQGFGPLRPESRSVVSTSVNCSPCGKDGTYCFRSGKERYLCLQTLPEIELRLK
jgi:heptosyltransferase-2